MPETNLLARLPGSAALSQYFTQLQQLSTQYGVTPDELRMASPVAATILIGMLSSQIQDPAKFRKGVVSIFAGVADLLESEKG